MTDCASVIILTYNRLDLTKKMLESFFQTTDSPYHLIIVDNNSTDSTQSWLQQLNPPNEFCQDYHVIFNNENHGVAGGRNRGILIANERYNDDWIAPYDNDVSMPQGWLKQSINIMKSCPEYYIGVNFEGVRYPLITKNGHIFQYKERGNLGGGGICIPRSLHQKIGYYSTNMPMFAHEDADWSQRSKLAGYKMGYLETDGIHLGEDSQDTGEYRQFKNGWRQKNLAIFQKNCYDYASGRKSIYCPFSE